MVDDGGGRRIRYKGRRRVNRTRKQICGHAKLMRLAWLYRHLG